MAWHTHVGFEVVHGFAFGIVQADQDGAPGSFVTTFASFATVGDLVLTLIKAVVFAAIVAIVACDKGLTTKGGPAGVANSVNATVVASILLLMITNVVFTQMYVLLFPKAAL